MSNRNQTKYSSWQAVWTIAQREIAVLMRTKSVIVSLIIVLLLIVGGSFLAAYFKNKDDNDGAKVLAVYNVDAGALQLEDYNVRPVDSREQAEAAVMGEDSAPFDADVALAGTDRGFDIIDDSSVSASDSAALGAAIASLDTIRGLNELGVDPQDFARAMTPSEITEVDLSATGDQQQDESYWAAVTTTLLGISVLMYFIILFSANVGGRITSEKSSRIVEIILSTVRPMDLFAGKILGNLIFGFVGSAVVVAVGTAAVAASGLVKDVEIDYSVFPLLLIMFILGMFFFGTLYAASGSLVSRSEDLQSAQMPVLLLIFACIYAPAFGTNNLDSTFMTVLGWVPPTSLTMAPLHYAAGNFGLLELMASWAIFAVVTLILLFACARIFRNSILSTGTKKSWTKAFKGQPA